MSTPIVLAESIEKEGENKGVLNALFRLSLPSIFSGWLKSSFTLADVYAGGRLGSSALTALAVSVLFVWVLNSLSKTNSIGTLSLVSRALGEGEVAKSHQHIKQGALYAFGLGIFCSLLVLTLSLVSIWKMGLSDEVYQYAREYLVVMLAGGVFIFVADTLEQSFRAAGDAKTPLRVFGVFSVLNLVLNPLLSLGPQAMWPWSDAAPSGLGVVGVALATVLSYFGMVVTLYALAKRRGYLSRTSEMNKALGPLSFWRIGFPAAIAGVSFDLIWIIITPMITATQGGEDALAAITVAHRFESISYLTSLGLSSACGALVGQAIGMKRPGLARAIALRSSLWGLGFSAALATALIAFSHQAMALFSDDPTVIALGHDYFVLASFAIAFQSVEGIILGAFSGLGKTGLPSAISLTAYAARIPLVWALSDEVGVYAVFYAIAITASLSGLCVFVAFLWRGPRRAGVTFGATHANEQA